MDITLFELHLPNAEFNAPFAGRSSATEDPESEPEAVDSTANSERPARLGPLAALAAVAGLALLARYLRGGEADSPTVDEVEA